jgi:hypothetical protein
MFYFFGSSSRGLKEEINQRGYQTLKTYTMKNLKLVLLGLIFAGVISCEKEEETPSITLDDFVGTWNATSSVFTNTSNASETVDLITLGGELRFTMLEGGGVRTWFTLDTISDEWDAQAELTNSNTLTLTPVEMERGVNTYEFDLDDNRLTLTDKSTSFDFTLSDSPEVSATSVTTFVRN